MRFAISRFLVSSTLVLSAAFSAAAIDIPPLAQERYMVGPQIPLPAVNASDVAAAGDAIFVGQGGFGAGLQSIVRRDVDGTFTTLVTNLNAIGGIAYDAAGDRLLFTDNGGEQVGATTGDTIYALPNPRTAAAAVNASTLTLLPNGSIPFAQAVLALPSGDILIGDAAGPGSGRVVKLSGGVPTNLIPGLDYTGGISLNLTGDEIWVGNVDGSFVGSVERYSLAGALLGSVASGLSGALDQAANVGGSSLVTGGFADDFTSTIVRVGPGGPETIATGFGFSSGIGIDGPSQGIFVLDFGTSRIDSVLDTTRLTPGSFGKKDCHIEQWGGTPDVGGSGKPRPRWTCKDGDPTCDRDLAVNGSCTYLVGTCVRVRDALRTAGCVPVDIQSVIISSKQIPAAVSALQSAADAITPATAAMCSQLERVTVPADNRNRSITFDAVATATGRRIDRDKLQLRCLP